jgi:hypothetical protein
MGAKQQALRNAARRRMTETGQTYEAALRDVRREYEQGGAADQDSADERRFGFEDASAEEYRRPTYATGYFVAWGVMELMGEDQVTTLVDHAEASGEPGADPIVCHLCDRPVEVRTESEVHVGIALRDVVREGKPLELQFPVWTHEQCGQTRVWSWSQLTLERRRRRLPIDQADLPPKQHRSAARVEDYFVFTVPQDSPPVFYLQPGQGDRHGLLGFRADRLSDGFPELDLSREAPALLDEWSIQADAAGLQYIERKGTGRWYQPPAPWTPPTDWLAAAHYHQGAIFLTAPADSIPAQRLETSTGDLSDLIAVGRADVLFGGIIAISGLTA